MSQLYGGSRKKTGQNVKVVVRVRPMANEESNSNQIIVSCNPPQEIQAKDKKYTFDRVFSANSSQTDIYNYVIKPMVNDVLAGYNCTVFAYGQTGSGKTYTMTGGDPDAANNNFEYLIDERSGCIPRIATHIFEQLGLMNICGFSVKVSFLELYNEEVRDLLNNDISTSSLNLYIDLKGSVYIQHLNEVDVFNSKDIYELIRKGTLKRRTASTLLNNHSSRSHSVFTITVSTQEITATGLEVLKTGKINLVDLAGSENIAKSGAKDKRVQEMANINRSLLTLGRVITLLAENNKHIPYRESKLTRILQDSLGGNCKTCIIGTVCPALSSFEETLNTLEYASRARNIKNNPVLNKHEAKTQMIQDLTNEIEKLKKDLEAERSRHSGVYVAKDNWDQLNQELSMKSNILSHKNSAIANLTSRIEELETVREIKTKQHENMLQIFQKTKQRLKDQKVSMLKQEYALKYYLNTLEENHNTASDLVQKLTNDRNVLQNKLESQYHNQHANEKIIKHQSSAIGNTINSALMSVEAITNMWQDYQSDSKVMFESAITKLNNDTTDVIKNWTTAVQPKIHSQFEDLVQTIKSSTQHIQNNIGNLDQRGLVTTDSENASSSFEPISQFLDDLSNKKDLYSNADQSLDVMIARVQKSKENSKEHLRKLALCSDETRQHIIDQEAMLKFLEKIKGFVKDESKNTLQAVRVKECVTKVEKEHQLTKDKLNLISEICCKNEEMLIEKVYNEVQHNIEKDFHNYLTEETTLIRNSQSEALSSLLETNRTLTNRITANLSEIDNHFRTIEELRTGIEQELIPVKRTGDTPKQTFVNFPKKLTDVALPRTLLLQKFEEEHQEDLQNVSIDFSISEDLFDDFGTEEQSERLDNS
ncbi:hypothetical protein ABEB36_007591 [Hypothenemus hampei]|uniref:Kinesin-like protein n=1 Tax=Hypothenemus hampei TaxID=57062 RepID=A0ABD1EWZ1_HYPHA